jgi:riboflavin synthase
MFSGIIEAKEPIVKIEDLNQAIRIWVRRPDFFNDLKVGDSIAVDGVCLTLEANFNTPHLDVSQSEHLQFTVGHETLLVLKRTNTADWQNRTVNLERSLRFGDRVHGHLVTGHVEDIGQIVESQSLGENWILNVQIPPTVRPYCWYKGSLTVNGTSLTINQIKENTIEHCLIPETQKRTNLANLKVGDSVCLEPDSMAKAVFEMLKQFNAQSDNAQSNIEINAILANNKNS